MYVMIDITYSAFVCEVGLNMKRRYNPLLYADYKFEEACFYVLSLL